MVNKSFKPFGLYRLIASLFGLTKFKSIDFFDEYFELKSNQGSVTIKFIDVLTIQTQGIFFKNFQVTCDGKRYIFGGLSQKDSLQLIKYFKIAEENAWKLKFEKQKDILQSVSSWIYQLNNRTHYQRSSVFNSYVKKAKDLVSNIPGQIPTAVSNEVGAKSLLVIRDFLKNSDMARTVNNDEYVPLEIERQNKLFDEIESNPLTEEQRRAVVTDEDSNLVVASAGSGKTSVIVAKVGWLLRKKLRAPQEILLLAFAKDAKTEMSKRLSKRISENASSSVAVETFHSLGLSILADAKGKKPSLSQLAEDDLACKSFIQDAIRSNLNNTHYRHHMSRWFTEFFAPYVSEFDFQNYGQYWSYIKKNNIRSLKKEKLKSFEECEIANFLFLNEINYIYEKDYEHDTADRHHRQYKPDFYLPDYDIYIEHLGLKGFGRTAPFIDRKSYLKSLRWKRNLHKTYGTTLIETYSCEKSQGVLTKRLRDKLSEHGVIFKEISPEHMFEILNDHKQIDPFTTLVATFLGHFKGSQLNELQLLEKNQQFSGEEALRNAAFIEVFIPIYESYENKLKEEHAIDFHDMISEATNLVKDKKYKMPFRYVMVDEFQDISVGRSKLLSAIQNSSNDTQMFCVGDDWQSIFRFAGSDINVMKDFGDYFSVFERSDLTVTFRSEEKITKHATHFILQNENQIPKDVSSVRTEEGPSIVVCFEGKNKESLLVDIITEITENTGETEVPNILVLGRYNLKNYNEDYKAIFAKIRRKFPQINLDYKTVHRSKGLEADYVIILEVISGFLGFPNEMADDHVLNMVLAKREKYPNAEERRLFYVALTRAKKKVFLCTESGNTSQFIDEIIQSPFDSEIWGKEPSTLPNCSKCTEGKLTLKGGKYGNFWGCENFPYCEFKEQPCPHCKIGYPKSDITNQLICDFCDQRILSCPKPECNGHLQQENGPHGAFWGCSKFRDTGCNYKQKIVATSEENIIDKKLEKKSPWGKNQNNHANQVGKQIKEVEHNLLKSQERQVHTKSPTKNNIQEIRKRHPNAYKPWSKEEDDYLRKLVQERKNNREVSDIMGRQTSAIRSRKDKLGL